MMPRRAPRIATPRPATPRPALSPPERRFTSEEVEALVAAKLAEASVEAETARQLAEVERQTAAAQAALDVRIDSLRARLAAEDAAARAELDAARLEREQVEVERRRVDDEAEARRVDAEREKAAAAIERRSFLRQNGRTAVLVALRDAGVIEERIEEATDAALEGFAVVEREPRGFYIERVGGPEVYTDGSAADLARAFLRDQGRDFVAPPAPPKSTAPAPARPETAPESYLRRLQEIGEEPSAGALLRTGWQRLLGG